MNYREYQVRIRRDRLEDEWWVAVDGVVQDETASLADLLIQRRKLSGKRIQLINVQDAEGEKKRWTDFEFEPQLSLKNSRMERGSDSVKEASRQVQTYAGVGRHRFEKKSPFENPVVEKKEDNSELAQVFNKLALETRKLEQAKLRLKERELRLIEFEERLISHERKLDARSGDLYRRERYVEKAEEKLIGRTFEHDEREAQIEQWVEDYNFSTQ